MVVQMRTNWISIQLRAADQVVVAHRYNCSDNPLNVARKKLYENSATTRLDLPS